MAAARLKKTNLCAECFPYGMADQPADATVVSCEHGAWDAKAVKPKDAGGQGDGGQGDGGQGGEGGDDGSGTGQDDGSSDGDDSGKGDGK